MRSFFDTNVLVYLFDKDAPEKQARARVLLQNESEAGQVVLSTQVLQEFYVAVTRKLATPLQHAEAEQAVRHFATLPVAQIETSLILNAIQRSYLLRLSFWDALIVSTALRSGAGRLLTEDLQHGRVIEGMRIENPFLTTARSKDDPVRTP